MGPTGQAAKRRGAADGSFMGHQFFKKLLFKYTGGFFFVVLFKFLAFVRSSAQGYDSAPASALKQVGQTYLQLTQMNKKTRKSQFHQQLHEIAEDLSGIKERSETHIKPLFCSF